MYIFVNILKLHLGIKFPGGGWIALFAFWFWKADVTRYIFIRYVFISKSFYILHWRPKYFGRDQFCIMVELSHSFFVSILKGKVSKAPFIDKIVVNTFDIWQGISDSSPHPQTDNSSPALNPTHQLSLNINRLIFRQLRMPFIMKLWWQKKIDFLQM